MFNEDHDELAPNELEYNGYSIATNFIDENGEFGDGFENIHIILENPKRNTYMLDFFQMVILGVVWGLLSKVVPRLFGYKNSSFGDFVKKIISNKDSNSNKVLSNLMTLINKNNQNTPVL